MTIESLAPCRKVLKVDVDAKTVDDAFETVTNEFQRGVKLPGFRPGKVPRDIIARNFAKDVESEVRRKIVNDSYKKALADHKLHVVGSPEVKEGNFTRSQNFTFDITVETAPDFELPDYKGLPAKKEKRTVGEVDVTRAIDVLRERMASYNDVDRAAKEGDIVVVHYSGTSEGRPLTDFAPTARGLTQQQNFWLEIKPGHFIPGFTEQLVGISKGDKRTVTVQFPEDFVTRELTGKQGVFEVEAVQVKEKAMPEANDEFDKQWGAENFEKLKQGVRVDLENELEGKIRQAVRAQVVQALSQKLQFELPESLVQGETRNVVYNIVAENQQRGVAKENIEEKRDEIFNYASQSAKERLKLGFLFGRIAEKEGIKVSREEVTRRVLQIAQQREMKPEKLVKELDKSGGFSRIHEDILMSKVVDFLEQSAQIEEVEPAPDTAPQG
ncbi:MAG TPA: trigger factor [Candidatus Kapabacteria bacterium]|nr:trigger factor [Candidatus Kapabacteria bacterium]